MSLCDEKIYQDLSLILQNNLSLTILGKSGTGNNGMGNKGTNGKVGKMTH